MIDRLAEIGLRVANRLASFPHHERHEPSPIGFEQIGRPLEHRSARVPSQAVEVPAGSPRRFQRLVDGFLIYFVARCETTE